MEIVLMQKLRETVLHRVICHITACWFYSVLNRVICHITACWFYSVLNVVQVCSFLILFLMNGYHHTLNFKTASECFSCNFYEQIIGFYLSRPLDVSKKNHEDYVQMYFSNSILFHARKYPNTLRNCCNINFLFQNHPT